MLVALLTVGIGVLGILSPDGGTTIRRFYFGTSGRMYAAAAVRLVMGLVLIAAASSSRWPRMLLVFGALMCMQALSGTLMGTEHARAIMEWESVHPALLRAGALVALASGALIAFAVAPRPTEGQG